MGLLAWTPSARPAARPGRVAYVGTDNDIYVCIGDCRKTECVTCPVDRLEARAEGLAPVALWADDRPVENSWPTFSPDGAKLAYISRQRDEERASFAVNFYDFRKHYSVRVFDSAERAPIYLFWLPDSRSISFLVTERAGLSLLVARAAEDAPTRVLMTGMPLFYDFNQPQNRLAVHANATAGSRAEQTTLFSLTDKEETVDKVLAQGHAPFKSPAWSRDGRHLAYVATRGEKAVLYVAEADGSKAQAMAELPDGESSFVWSPDSVHIAFATGEFNGSFIFHGIKLLDIADGKVRNLCRDPVSAYFFSPDARRLAYIGSPARKPYFTWHVIELASGKSTHLANFITTREESIAYRYFEQIALSHSIWAPDSSAITFAGVIVKGEPRRATGPAPPPTVWILPADKSAPTAVGQGVLGFWSSSAD